MREATLKVRAAVVAVTIGGAANHLMAQVWEAGPSFPAAPDSRQHAVALNVQGALLALGGPPWINVDEDGSVHSLAFNATNWQEELGLDGIGAIVSQGGGVDDLGRIVMFGGDDPDNLGAGKAPFEWDFLEGPWHDLAARGVSAPSLYFAYCTDELHRIYSFGGGLGAEATPGEPNSTYCERYLGSLDAWEVIAPLPQAVADAAATPDGLGHLLVLGGYTELGDARTDLVQQYDIVSDTWSTTAVPPLPEALTGHAAALGADGRVYILGGTSGPVGGDVVVNTCYVLNPLTNEWSTGPALAEARRWFGAVLSDDDYLYALGGNTGAGGTTSVERLYTVPCPTFTDQPEAVDAWRGQTIELHTAVAGGGTIALQWQRDGVDLVDGPTGWGSTIVGAGSMNLRLESPQVDDSGAYELVATNSCGTTTSDPAGVSVQAPPDLPTEWQFVSLHPAWALSSVANDVDDGQQGGVANKPVGDWDNMERAVIWSGSAASAIDITPPTTVGASVSALEDGVQVGWWWWPHDCWNGSHWVTCYTRRGAMWEGSAASHHDLYGPGWEYANAVDTNGVEHVGTIASDDNVGNTSSHGVLYPPPNYWPIDLHPAGFHKSGMTAIDGDRQFGWVQPSVGSGYHVGMWSGSRDSFVELHPAGAPTSMIHGAGDGQQVGTINWYTERRATVWAGTVASYLDLQPPTADASEARDCEGGLQIGSAQFPGLGLRSLVWASDPTIYVDLTEQVPAGYLGAGLNGIDVQPDGTIVIVGSSYNTALERTEAAMWIGGAQPGCAGDLDGDGDTDQADLGVLLAAYNNDAAGDLDGDGDTDQADLGILLADYGCI